MVIARRSQVVLFGARLRGETSPRIQAAQPITGPIATNGRDFLFQAWGRLGPAYRLNLVLGAELRLAHF